MNKAYFQYYETFETIVQKFSSVEEQNAMRTKIINYGLFGLEPEELSIKEDMVWDIVKDLIDDQKHRREVNTSNRKSKKQTETNENEIEETESGFIEENEEKSPSTSEKEIKSPFQEKTTENEKNEEKSRFSTEKEIKSPSAELNRNELNRIEMKRSEMECTPSPAKPEEGPHSKHFVKPTLDEIKNYCLERNNGINPERFLDYYEAKGWKVGNSPMKDWKAAVRTWEQKNETPHYAPSPGRILPEDHLTF